MTASVRDQSIVPVARTEDLVVTRFGDELTVYDQATHSVHHLNGPVVLVWQMCDGQRTISDLMGSASLDRDAVVQALAQLERASLLVGTPGYAAKAGESRRALLRKAAIAGIATPVIVSVTAPAAAASTSPGAGGNGGSGGLIGGGGSGGDGGSGGGG